MFLILKLNGLIIMGFGYGDLLLRYLIKGLFIFLRVKYLM